MYIAHSANNTSTANEYITNTKVLLTTESIAHRYIIVNIIVLYNSIPLNIIFIFLGLF